MNKFIECNNHIAEIRPDRMYRWFARIDPFELYNSAWREDDLIDDKFSWENEVKNGLVKVINIEQFIEMNFEHFV